MICWTCKWHTEWQLNKLNLWHRTKQHSQLNPTQYTRHLLPVFQKCLKPRMSFSEWFSIAELSFRSKTLTMLYQNSCHNKSAIWSLLCNSYWQWIHESSGWVNRRQQSNGLCVDSEQPCQALSTLITIILLVGISEGKVEDFPFTVTCSEWENELMIIYCHRLPYPCGHP